MQGYSKDTLMIVASNLTIAEMIYGLEPDSHPSIKPSDYAYEAFKAHLKILEEEYPSE